MSKQKQKGISFGYCDLNTGQRVYPSLSDAIPEEIPPAQQLYQASDSMYAGITCVPPIGQPTVLPRDQDSVSALDRRSGWRDTEVVRLISLFCLKRMLRRWVSVSMDIRDSCLRLPSSRSVFIFHADTFSTVANDQDIKVAIWHDQGGQEWAELSLKATDELGHVVCEARRRAPSSNMKTNS